MKNLLTWQVSYAEMSYGQVGGGYQAWGEREKGRVVLFCLSAVSLGREISLWGVIGSRYFLGLGGSILL